MANHQMIGRSHFIIGGMAAAWAMPTPFDPALMGMAFAVGGLSALLPDLDSDESEIRQLTGTNKASGVFGWLASLLAPKHRGITHTAWIVAALMVLYFRHPSPIIAAFVIGYISHICADMLTLRRVKLFAPFSQAAFGLPLIQTGSWGETFIVIACIGLFVSHLGGVL